MISISELNYEQALVQFLKAIEIEPMNPRGYAGAAEAYVGLGRIDEAISVLEKGYEITGDGTIKTIRDSFMKESVDENSIENDVSPSDEIIIQLSGAETALSREPKPTRLTGKEPFSSMDLDKWGLPWRMGAEEVVNLFHCENSDILEFIRNPLSGSFVRSEDNGIYVLYDSNAEYVGEDGSYTTWMSIRDDGNFTITYKATYQNPNDDYSEITIVFENGIAVIIDVYYYYSDIGS